MIYLLIFIIIFICVIRYDLSCCKQYKKESLFFITFILIMTSGLSYRLGGDGYCYFREYDKYLPLWDLDAKYFDSFSNRLPGWLILTSITKSLIDDYWFFKLVHAIIINSLFIYGLSKCTRYIFTGILFYFVLLYFEFNFQILRESLSISIFMYSLPFYFNNKWKKYYACCIFALFFHESSLVAFILPLFRLWDKNSKIKIVFVFLLFLIVIYGQVIRDTIIQMIPIFGIVAGKIDSYTQFEGDYTFVGFGNLFLNLIIPLYVIYYMEKKGTPIKYRHLIVEASFLYAFYLVFYIFYRFIHFFSIFVYLSFIVLIGTILFHRRSFRVLKFSICCFLLLGFKARVYLLEYGESNVPSYCQYYPYASVFEKSTDPRREKLLYSAYNEEVTYKRK